MSDGYALEKMIGRGAFATVWKAWCPAKGVNVAIKVMDLENVTHSFEDIRQEVRMYTYICSHVHILLVIEDGETSPGSESFRIILLQGQYVLIIDFCDR
ncbi:unnamed protein product [Choristocarpus tenellus]